MMERQQKLISGTPEVIYILQVHDAWLNDLGMLAEGAGWWRHLEARRRHPERIAQVGSPQAGQQSCDVSNAGRPTRQEHRCLGQLGGLLPRLHPRTDPREAGKRSLPTRACRPEHV